MVNSNIIPSNIGWFIIHEWIDGVKNRLKISTSTTSILKTKTKTKTKIDQIANSPTETSTAEEFKAPSQ